MVFQGTTATLNDGILTLDALKGDKGDDAVSVVRVPDATGAVMEYQNPSKIEFTNAVGSIDSVQTLTITPTGPSITTDDATTYPHGTLTEIVFNNMSHSIVKVLSWC